MIIRKFLSLFLALSVVLASCEKPKEEARKASESEKKTNGQTTEASEKETTGKPPALKQWHVSTVAGGGTVSEHRDATGTAARFAGPRGIAVSSDGSTLYVADRDNDCIRKIALPSGVVTTFAGSTRRHSGHRDATGTAALFEGPVGIAASSDGSTLYVTDKGNRRIRKIALPLGVVTTFAGSGTRGYRDDTGLAAQFHSALGIALASDGALYVAERNLNTIRKIDISSKVVTTFAGSRGTRGDRNAQGLAAQFHFPYGMAASSDGSTLYVADEGSHRIRKIDLSSGDVTTFAGSTRGHRDDIGIAAQFNAPHGIAASSDGSALYVADEGSHRIRKIDLSSGDVTTIAGSTRGHRDDIGIAAQFDSPNGIAVSLDGTLYVTDEGNDRIRKIEFKE